LTTSRSGRAPRVSVVVPTFDGADLVAALLRSLERQTIPHEVIVVDNGSTDRTAEVVGAAAGVRLVRLDANVGFGRAVNRGVVEAQGDTLVLLNNDVECEPEFLERLCDALDPGSGVTMAAGVLLKAHDPRIIDTAGIEFDPTLLAFDYLHGQERSVLDNGVRDPIGPCAGAAAFHREAFEGVGGFDENIFAYLEDVDLIVRLLARGDRCRLAPGALALHRHSATLGARSRAKNDLIGWSRGYLIGKYRLHRRPGLFARTVVEELTGALGKLAVDRAGLALRPRLKGWRAGRSAQACELPSFPPRVHEISILEAHRRRIRRRAHWLQTP